MEINELAQGLAQLTEEFHAREERIEALEEQKDQVYRERNNLVHTLAKIFPAHLMRHPEEDESWEDNWRWIVCVHLKGKTLTWHIRDEERAFFDFLEVKDADWDGTETREKYGILTNASREELLDEVLPKQKRPGKNAADEAKEK